MKLEYNPRNVFRIVSQASLQTYFLQRSLLAEFDWSNPEDDRERLYAAWLSLPSADRRATSIEFERANALCSRKGIQVLLDAGRAVGKDVLQTIDSVKGTAEKVFNVLLNHPEIFRLAGQFLWADNLTRYWHRRRGLPKIEPDLGEAALASLKKAISVYYVHNQARGEFCHVDVYKRATKYYMMVYLADYPSSVMCFEDSDKLRSSVQQEAFDVVYTFDPSEGRLDLYAEGSGDLRTELSQAFVRHILRQDLHLDPIGGPVFDLERLKEPEFRFRVEPSDKIVSIRMKSMRLAAVGLEGGRITYSTPARSKDDGLRRFISRSLNATTLPLAALQVEHVTIQALLQNGRKRPTSVVFSLSCGNACNLKDTPENNGILECLKRSEVICG